MCIEKKQPSYTFKFYLIVMTLITTHLFLLEFIWLLKLYPYKQWVQEHDDAHGHHLFQNCVPEFAEVTVDHKKC